MNPQNVPLKIRAIHWAIALAFPLNALVMPAGDLPHRLLGYGGAGLVATRLILMLKHKQVYLNPKAIFVYSLIWLCIASLGVTGWMTQLDAFWGNSLLKQVHETIVYIMLSLVFVHLSGVFIDALRHKRKTWMKMISGSID